MHTIFINILFNSTNLAYYEVRSRKSQDLVHHMELFHCDVDPDMKIPVHNGQCTNEQKLMSLIPYRCVT